MAKEKAPAAAPAPAKEKAPAAVKYICVLAVKENSGNFAAGAEYTGERVEHLLKRGAIKAV